MSTAQAEAPWKAGLRGARANLVPGLVLQVFALTLVLAYYHVPVVHEALQRLMDFRLRTGFAYAVVATSFFGGLLPLLYLRAMPATRARFDARQGFALVLFWGLKGIEVDLLYRVLAAVFGEGASPGVVLPKMVVDQLIYCPVWAMPTSWLFYAWLETRFDARAVAADVRAPAWYRRRILPVLLANASVWVPAVAIIYLLPTPLQLPLQNLVLCFFTLLLAHLTQRRP